MKSDTGSNETGVPNDIGTLHRAIRTKCLLCSDRDENRIEQCPFHGCPLYPYRKGGEPSPEDIDSHREAWAVVNRKYGLECEPGVLVYDPSESIESH